MDFMALNIDGGEGTGGTEMLAGTATDASALVDSGYVGRLVVIGIAGHHLDGSRGTMAGTVATINAIGENQAVFLNPYGVADLRGCFQFLADGLDGTGRADLRTTVALRAAVAFFVAHGWHHQVHQVVRGAQDLVGTF